MGQPVIKQLTQFALVGGLGTVTNLVVFFGLVDVADMDPFVGAVVAFVVAVTQNYVLNELWTFNPEGINRVTRWRFAKFVFFSSLALCVNLLVLWGLIRSFEFPLMVIPQAAGIAVATIFNFLTSRLITFR